VAGHVASVTFSQVARIRVSTNPIPLRLQTAVAGQTTDDTLVGVVASGTGGV